ncbi:hypothetical protein [Homoserinimonas sp. A520]
MVRAYAVAGGFRGWTLAEHQYREGTPVPIVAGMNTSTGNEDSDLGTDLRNT